MTYSLLACCAAVMIALAGITSATVMAPERGEVDKLETAFAFGLTGADFCEGGTAGHKHECPFCLTVSKAPTIRPVETLSILLPFDGWRALAGLTRHTQAEQPHYAVRAPPTLS
ncbi:hypothetical protein GCM10011498_30270 [Amylibacter cionae]|uniref:DUF2946 domain-containing protein n=1 Tax=Neptunicoccus cionae TaxID=2035344 RepID=A0A916QZZ9_9RHOB|nr:hypothetical protein GCM10011498_30270 [Amylibacter cionae]